MLGAGHAADQLVHQLHDHGWRAPVTVVGDEPHPPYHRPPLSKDYLAGSMGADRLPLRAEDFYASRDARLLLGSGVLDLGLRPDGTGAATLGSGERVDYERLVLATGASARTVPSLEGLAGVLVLRTRADADLLRDAIRPGARVVVVGAGFVGLEVAATAVSLGAEVRVLEAADRVLSRVVGPLVSAHVEAHHRAAGTEVLTGRTVIGAESVDGRVVAVDLSDGSRLPADVVVVGIGGVPRDELAAAAGLECRGGVLVDAGATASDGRTLAIGDCATAPDPSPGAEGAAHRHESIDNAAATAAMAARTLLGLPPVRRSAPWAWSDQGDLKVQVVGTWRSDEPVVRHSPDGRKLAVIHLLGTRVAAAEVVGAPADFAALRQAVDARVDLDPRDLVDPSVRLAGLVRSRITA